MPVLVPCGELRAGMRLSEGFYLGGRMMLPGGKALTLDDIDSLRRKFPDVILKVGDPVLDSLVTFEDDTREREVAHQVTQQIAGAMHEVQMKFSARANAASLDFNSIRKMVGDVVEFLKNNPVSMALINRGMSDKSYLAEHSGNVFYLSMVLGSAVQDYVVKERLRQTRASTLSPAVAMDLLPLGLGAMFLDVAMSGLQHVFTPGYELTAEDRKAIWNHPSTGAEMLPESIPPAARMVVRTHHENMDGTGYPSRMPGAGLHVFSRIAKICDAFDAATSEKLYTKAKSPSRALWEMTAGPHRKHYDPVLMKVLAGVIQPFPIGAKLQLVDGRHAVVVRYNRKAPFHPTAVVAFDAQGERLPVDQMVGPINLGEGNGLAIGAFGGEDLSYVRETAQTTSEPVESGMFQEVGDAAYP